MTHDDPARYNIQAVESKIHQREDHSFYVTRAIVLDERQVLMHFVAM